MPEDADGPYSAMGSDLGPYFQAIFYEVAAAYRRWHDYVELFGTSPKRIELLNGTAPSFFALVQEALWHETLLEITRLTDPVTTGGRATRANLTIQRLPILIDDPELRARTGDLVGSAVDAAAFARDWRNRRIAHRDLALSMKDEAAPLAPASRKRVKDALAAICAVLDPISLHYSDSTSYFDLPGPPGSAGSLLNVLSLGKETRDEVLERHRRGEFKPEDRLRGDF